MLVINKSVFVKSVANSDDIITDNLPEIAFVGRSNVGKSSLINSLTGESKLARASSTPGRTRLINYFLINDKFYLVDLPGYGFAKASKDEVDSWQSLLEPYLIDNKNLKCVCVLVDSRIEPTELDKQMISFLCYHCIPFVVIATKCDKFAKSKVNPQLAKIAHSLGLAKDNIIYNGLDKFNNKSAILSKLQVYLNIK